MSDQLTVEAPASTDKKIVCHIDNALVHSVQIHIKNNYADTWTIDRYKEEFPGEPVLSPMAQAIVDKKRKDKADVEAKAVAAAHVPVVARAAGESSQTFAVLVAEHSAFHTLFELGEAKAARNGSGDPIVVTVLSGHDEASMIYLPAIDDRYVFNIELLKEVIIGFELGMNVYLWGYHGTGKTTLLEQAAARTRRPFVRVQHTINMQESDVLGQWTVKDGATEFQLGPLPMSMLNGWVYCADEYDFAMPSVTAVYQPVLEGKPLLIKDAPLHFRHITPHPNFRFVATGNTNGVGDETGLYQGTLIQNAANYSRFHITEEVKYMDAKLEENVLISQCDIDRGNASKVVKFANEVRKQFTDGKIGMTISPRELINAVDLGVAYGGNWMKGLELAFANRLSRVDKKVVMEFGQRMF